MKLTEAEDVNNRACFQWWKSFDIQIIHSHIDGVDFC